MSLKLLVIGYGMVAHRFVHLMQELDIKDIEITVLSSESFHAYDRVGLSKYVNEWDVESLTLDNTAIIDKDHISVHLGQHVHKIDRDKKIVYCDSGDVFEYDKLVLATGSYPFVPPIPGSELPNCVTYRTIDDLDKLRALAEKSKNKTGVVIGGGLLGLEAANALKLLGITAHVVEYAPRLMPLQVDTGGGATLHKLITDIGVNVHTGVGTTLIEPSDDGVELTLSNDEKLQADLVVFSAGVRPQDQIAKDCGLEIAERGGVVTDLKCVTSDPNIYAIGEVAAIEGKCYGLVAPGYSTARVVANQLANKDDLFEGADLSTKLKLLGVDVASFGDVHALTEKSLELVSINPILGTYQKLVMADDGRTLLGGVLVGDATNYALLQPMLGSKLPTDPMSFITPQSEGSSSGFSIGNLPDTAQICSCNAVHKGTILNAIKDGAHNVEAIKTCTKAGTTCGGCVKSLNQLLTVAGVEVPTNICEHFNYSRTELLSIIKVSGITTFSELIQKHGKGLGCNQCKPVVASLLASITNGHSLSKDLASLQDTNDYFLANIQKNGTYSIVPRSPGGEITGDQLIAIGQIAKDFDLYTKLTGAQRIDIFGARVDQLPEIWKRLVDVGMESGAAYGKSLRAVKSCVGTSWCRFGVQDSVGMAVHLESRYRGVRSPHKIKMGVSGCTRECAEARGKDVGIIASEKGWNMFVCGNGGQSPKHAVLLAEGIDDETLIKYIDRFVMFYIRTAENMQRTAPWLESLEGGIEYLKQVICEDKLGLGEELERQMEEHVGGYEDEWAGVLKDPEKLARFKSFANAPQTPDPTIKFESQEGKRKIPVLLGQPRVLTRSE